MLSSAVVDEGCGVVQAFSLCLPVMESGCSAQGVIEVTLRPTKIYLPLFLSRVLRLLLCCATQPHTLLGSALGLLLVFRTNAAYQRFQEGRKLWEEVLNVSRDIARMTSLYEDGEARRCWSRAFILCFK